MGVTMSGEVLEHGSVTFTTLKGFKENGYHGLLQSQSSDRLSGCFEIVYIDTAGRCYLLKGLSGPELLLLNMDEKVSDWPEWGCEPFYGTVNISITNTEEWERKWQIVF